MAARLKLLIPLVMLAGGCVAAPEAAPPSSGPPSPPDERYRALGQEPGWTLTIANRRIDYVGDYGETRIAAPRPDPRRRLQGRRYETPRLTVDIEYERCNDAMSGHGYEHQVTVIAASRTVRGCGGERRTDWDV